MKISLIQMDMKLGRVEENFAHARELIEKACREEQPDVVVLPETWNVGFFPAQHLQELADADGERTCREMRALAKEFSVNIVAGSVATYKAGQVFNTAYVFDRSGECLGSYDKTHLFTPMGEHEHFAAGQTLLHFTLDGVRCGLVICYDIRFPELTRTLALQGMDVLFMVSQWPLVRVPHLQVLTQARAIENQMFVACCNSCADNGDAVFGGSSALIDPWGKVLARAGEKEEILTDTFDLSVLEGIRSSINVYRDRRPALYDVGGGAE